MMKVVISIGSNTHALQNTAKAKDLLTALLPDVVFGAGNVLGRAHPFKGNASGKALLFLLVEHDLAAVVVAHHARLHVVA